MTVHPVEVDICLTSLTFAQMFETADQLDILIRRDLDVDVLVVQTKQGILSEHLNRLLVTVQHECVTLCRKGRHFKRHLAIDRSLRRSKVAESELRLIFLERIQLGYVILEVVGLAGQQGRYIHCMQRGIRHDLLFVLKAREISRQHRVERTIGILSRHRDRLIVLQADIQFIESHTGEHVVRHGVAQGLTCCQLNRTFGNTRRRTV